jgi:Trk K+ transport system NAD-binding subunit
MVACTDNDLVNVTACVEAKRLNPGIRTVARIFDDDLAERLDTFGIDAALSMSRTAAGAFIGAATDERAVRHIDLDGLELVAFRHQMRRSAGAGEVEGWRREGLRILAVHRDDQALPPTAAVDGVRARDQLIVAGPEPATQLVH